MDIALIIGVVVGLAAMIGSIAYALFVEGSAGVLVISYLRQVLVLYLAE